MKKPTRFKCAVTALMALLLLIALCPLVSVGLLLWEHLR